MDGNKRTKIILDQTKASHEVVVRAFTSLSTIQGEDGTRPGQQMEATVNIPLSCSQGDTPLHVVKSTAFAKLGYTYLYDFEG